MCCILLLGLCRRLIKYYLIHIAIQNLAEVGAPHDHRTITCLGVRERELGRKTFIYS